MSCVAQVDIGSKAWLENVDPEQQEDRQPAYAEAVAVVVAEQ